MFHAGHVFLKFKSEQFKRIFINSATIESLVKLMLTRVPFVLVNEENGIWEEEYLGPYVIQF
jgi:hypothetical protein